MVMLSQGDILMSGHRGATAFVDVRSIGGLRDETNRQLAEGNCQVLKESLGIPPARVYVTFADIRESHRGVEPNYIRVTMNRHAWLVALEFS